MEVPMRETVEMDFESKAFSFKKDLDGHLVTYTRFTCEGSLSEKGQVTRGGT